MSYKQPFEVIEVTEIATGKKVKIKDYRFNAELHSKGEVLEATEKFEYNGKEYKTEAAMKSAITKDSKINE